MQRDKQAPQRDWFHEWTTAPGTRPAAGRPTGAATPQLTESSRRLLRVTASDWMGSAPADKPKRKA